MGLLLTAANQPSSKRTVVELHGEVVNPNALSHACRITILAPCHEAASYRVSDGHQTGRIVRDNVRGASSGHEISKGSFIVVGRYRGEDPSVIDSIPKAKIRPSRSKSGALAPSHVLSY